MTSLVFPFCLMITGIGIEGPIEDLYAYAEQQEQALLGIASFTARIVQVRENQAARLPGGEGGVLISESNYTESTVIGGPRFVEKVTVTRIHTARDVQRMGLEISFLLLEDMVAQVTKGEPLVRVFKFVPGLDMPPNARRVRSAMNTRDILLHGFGDGFRTIRTLCDEMQLAAEQSLVRITKTEASGNSVIYSLEREGKIFLDLEIDPERNGMVVRAVHYDAVEVVRRRLEVFTKLGRIANGETFPTLWRHEAYIYESENDTCGKVAVITRNELLDLEIGNVDPNRLTFAAFGLSNKALVAVQEFGSDSVLNGHIEDGILIVP